jgi:Prohead core protein serine protease
MKNKDNILLGYVPFSLTKEALNEAMTGDIAKKTGKTLVTGVLQRAEAKNQNGRVYPYEILMREAKKYEEGFVRQKRALGELDHPESSVVNLKNVSHNISRMWWDGKDLMGEVEILPTPCGNILKELLKAGITLGISSRGMGSVKELAEGTVEVQDDFNLISFDFVSNPSTVGAFMFPEETLNESVSHKVVHNPLTNKWESTETIIRDILSEIK